MNIKKTIIACVLVTILALTNVNLAASATNSFKDVPKNHWGYKDIMNLVDLKIISGFPDGTYKPNAPLTRAQAAIIIGRTLNINIEQTNQHTFSDVNAKTSGYEYIHALTNRGVFAKANKFNPTTELTREQMATILVKAFHLNEKGTYFFNDVHINSWAYDNIQTLVATNITKGTSNNTFSPKSAVTRAQMAAFIIRTLEYLEVIPKDPETMEQESFKIVASEILNLTNRERQKHNLPPLKLNQNVQNVAMVKAKDFYIHDYFAHTSPVHGSAFDMLDKERISYVAAGENIAEGYWTAKMVVDAWMNSEGHRKNILSKQYTHIGIGYFTTDKTTQTYHSYVQIFTRP